MLIPSNIRWLGGRDARARYREKKIWASTVVFAVLGDTVGSLQE